MSSDDSKSSQLAETEITGLAGLPESLLREFELLVKQLNPGDDGSAIYTALHEAKSLLLHKWGIDEIGDPVDIPSVSEGGINLVTYEIQLIKDELDSLNTAYPDRKSSFVCEMRQQLVDELLMLIDWSRSSIDPED